MEVPNSWKFVEGRRCTRIARMTQIRAAMKKARLLVSSAGVQRRLSQFIEGEILWIDGIRWQAKSNYIIIQGT
jgi:hypothetical protein